MYIAVHSLYRTVKNNAGQVRTVQDRSGQCRTGQDRARQVRTVPGSSAEQYITKSKVSSALGPPKIEIISPRK